MSGMLSQCMDYFLGKGCPHVPEIQRLIRENTANSDEILLH